MQDLSDDDRKQVLGEVLFDELRAIRESLDYVPKRAEFNDVKEKVESIDRRTTTIELVVKDVSRKVNQHTKDIEVLHTR